MLLLIPPEGTCCRLQARGCGSNKMERLSVAVAQRVDQHYHHWNSCWSSVFTESCGLGNQVITKSRISPIQEYLESEDFVESLYTPGLIFLLNTALPVLFMVLDHQYVGIISLSEQNLAKFEYYHNPATNLRLLKARSYLLRIAAIFITVASIYRKANENEVWTHMW